MNKKSLSRIGLRNILLEALEVYSEEKNPGFERNSQHREAISLLKTRKKNVTDSYFLDAIKKEGIKSTIDLDNYFFWSQNRAFWTSLSSFEDLKIGESGVNLGISRSTDAYMYQKIGENKYRVVAGPKPEQMGFEFTKMPKSTPSTRKNKQKKDKPNEHLVKHEYVIGNSGVANGVKGTKMIKRIKGDTSRSIVMTYLIPDSLEAMEIQSRVPPKPFKKVDDKKEIGEVVKEFERLTGNKIPFDIGAGKEKIVSKLSGKKLPPSEFINTFGPIIKNSVGASGVFPSVTLAQAILETGWGRSTVGDANNMFGIKAKGKKTQYWQGDSTVSKTIEYIQGKKGSYNLGFRKYASIEDSIRDHNLLLQKSRYKKAIDAATPEEQAKEIKAAGYATDPKYAEKLISLINKYDLKQFDSEVVALKGSQKSEDPGLAENKKRKVQGTIITEEKIRQMVRRLLLIEISSQDKKRVKFIQGVIGTKDDGDWGNNTDAEWAHWVEEHVDVLVNMSEDSSLSEKDILDIKGNAAKIASKVFNDKSKENLAGVEELVKKCLDNKSTVKSKYDTDDKYQFVRGPKDGLYPGGLQGMKNDYVKIFYNDVAIALDIKTGQIKQRTRGMQKPFGFEQDKNLKESVYRKIILERFINPAKIYMDISNQKNIANDDTFEEIGVTTIVSAADKGLENYKKEERKEKIKKLDKKTHTFADEYSLPIKFEQQDMSVGATVATQLKNDVGGAKHTNVKGAKKIIDLVVKPLQALYGATMYNTIFDRSGESYRYKDAYKAIMPDNANQVAWSSHTFNRMITTDHPFYEQNKNIAAKVKSFGMAYPWPSLMKQRREIAGNMTNYVGKTVALPFSKEEVDARSDLSIVDGVFTLNGRQTNKGKGIGEYTAMGGDVMKKNSHMNIVVGNEAIGGNLSNTVKADTIPADGFPMYIILVKVVENKPNLV